jgi:prepilin-type N-terminal cleavage/methylation domain-containing protein
MNERGHTLPELLVAIAIILITASVAIPHLKAYSVEAHLLAAGRTFKGEFMRARSIAVRASAQTAIRFENGPGGPSYSIYGDGNHNGVRSVDIASGKDRRIAGPLPLNGGASDVRVGINPGVPAIPPDRGILDPADPIRFGSSNILSFSPLGTATPGTFYLAGEGQQAAVRVTAGSARVRLMVCRGRKWVER